MKSLKDALERACEEVVEKAKTVDTYIDQTGNLRSSIGYVIYYNGEEVLSSFSAEKAEKDRRYLQIGKNSKGEKYGHVRKTPGGSGEDGAAKGLAFARSKAEESGADGFVAVVVAGMEYALYVESKGFDVLTGSALRFGELVKAQLARVNTVYGTNLING